MRKLKDNLLKNIDLYEKFKKDFTYHSSAIEGSTITISDNGTLVSSNENKTVKELKKLFPRYGTDEILENRNLGIAFDLMFRQYKEPITDEMLKTWHSTLKDKTDWSKLYSEATGKYRNKNVVVGGENFAISFEHIQVDVKNIIDDINYIENISLDDICEFHCRFEKIHPFQDGNGRIGRLVMLKQCLQANIIPFFINNNTREEYINCMKLFHRTGMSSFLSEYCAKQQKIFIQTYSEYLDNELNNNEKAIIDYLTNKKVATAEEISKLLNLGKTATNDNFNKLIDREIVERINAGKNTAYILKTK